MRTVGHAADRVALIPEGDRNMRPLIITTLLGLTLLGATTPAMAFGPHGGGPGFMSGRGGPEGPGKPLRLLVSQLSPDQRRQVRQIFVADRATMRDTLKAMHDAHEALADKMLAAGTVTEADIAPQVAKIAELHQQLLDHGTKVMLQIRAIATPDQLAKAASTKQKLDDLHQQIRTLLGEDGDDAPPLPE
jgi:Spy/CpxP family protein refolding chaperone